MNDFTVLDIDYMHQLSEKIKSSDDEREIDEIINYAMKFYGVYNFKLNYKSDLFRVRKCKGPEGFMHLSDIWHPPSEFTKAGRLNEPNKPFLYLSLTLETALLEVQAKEGDIFQVAHYQLKDGNAQLGIIGEKYRAIKGFGSAISAEFSEIMNELYKNMLKKDVRVALSFRYADAFFDELIRDPNARHDNYLKSRTVVKHLLEKHKHVDGLLYHSVASYGGQNMAFPAEKAHDLLGLSFTGVIKVKKAYPYGLYDIELIDNVKNIDEQGNVQWLNRSGH